MKLVSYEVTTALGRFERIGALVDGSIVDLNSAHTALLAESADANSARRQAQGLVPPDMISFLEGGEAAHEAATQAIASSGESAAVARVNGMPALAAARASSTSPWNHVSPADPVGPTTIGIA